MRHIIDQIKRSPGGSILELISITITVIFLVSLAGTLFGKIVMGVIGISYDLLKVWQILEVKKFYRKHKIWSTGWRIVFLGFLVSVALIASLSYALSTMEAQQIKIDAAKDAAVDPKIELDLVQAISDKLEADIQLESIEDRLQEISAEVDEKIDQIDILESGWITASDRLSTTITIRSQERSELTQHRVIFALQREHAISTINRLEGEQQVLRDIAGISYGSVASAEFTRVAQLLQVDAEKFLGIFLMVLLSGVEIGIIMLMDPEKIVPKSVKHIVPKKDVVLEEMDRVIDAMLKGGQGKLPGVQRISEWSNVSVVRVSAYRTLFIQQGLLQTSQGATSAVCGPKEMKAKARKFRDKIDI